MTRGRGGSAWWVVTATVAAATALLLLLVVSRLVMRTGYGLIEDRARLQALRLTARADTLLWRAELLTQTLLTLSASDPSGTLRAERRRHRLDGHAQLAVHDGSRMHGSTDPGAPALPPLLAVGADPVLCETCIAGRPSLAIRRDLGTTGLHVDVYLPVDHLSDEVTADTPLLDVWLVDADDRVVASKERKGWGKPLGIPGLGRIRARVAAGEQSGTMRGDFGEDRHILGFGVVRPDVASPLLLLVAVNGDWEERPLFVMRDIIAGVAGLFAVVMAGSGLVMRQRRRWWERERHRLEERLILERKAAHADRLTSAGLLAAGVAHEINNPLTYVGANLQHLDQRLDWSGQEHLRPAARDAIEGVERIARIVEDLRGFTSEHVEAPTPCDVRDAVEAAVRLAGPVVRGDVKLDLQLGPVPRVLAVEGRLTQVFLNLLMNAVQARDPARTTPHAVYVGTTTSGDEVVVTVRDTGVGMTPEVQAQLFGPFFTTKGPGAGTGLGLSVSQDIVHRIGGRIEVESRPGEGSTFRVVLPAHHEPAAAATSEPDTPPARTRARVLVVDDNVPVGRAIADGLPDHDVTVVASAAAALGALADHARSFDLVLCDVMMADLTGPTLFERIANLRPDLASRVVFMTGGVSTPGMVHDLIRTGRPVLCKPLRIAEIEALLGRLRS